MAKVKLIYEKKQFNIKKESDMPFDYSCCRISDMAIPIEMYKHDIDVVQQRKLHWDENLIILKSNDTKKELKCKVMTILNEYFSGRINIVALK